MPSPGPTTSAAAAELAVIGNEASQQMRVPLEEGRTLRLGRLSQNAVHVPWDPLISREHAEVMFRNGRLRVRRLSTGRNPVYFLGQPAMEFTLGEGEEFQIGSTSFRLLQVQFLQAAPRSLEERAYPAEELQAYAFRNPDHWLEALAGLPRLIEESPSDHELAQRIVRVLLEAVPRADAAAVVRYDSALMPGAARDGPAPQLLRWDSRSTDVSSFRPSRTLILTALERRESLLHVWNAEDTAQKFTYSGKFDWAFCVPIREEACRGWCLYVCGNVGEEIGVPAVISGDELQDELRFAELLAQFIGAIRQVRMLEERQAGLWQFFSPQLRETLFGMGDEAALEPREAEITVLFCDMRGGGRANSGQVDLERLLGRVDRVMEIMTRSIFDERGVIADFQGDAALGFWGWPVAADDGPLPACRAALRIQEAFRALEPDGEAGVQRLGIGIACGSAIAGRIGPDDQAKLGVFGPVVNLGARMQGMARQLRTSILIDEATAEHVRRGLPPSAARCRRLGRVRPYGMDEAVAVSELLPPVEVDPSISDEQIAVFERGVEAVAEGRWSEALALFEQLPAGDRSKDFMVLHIAVNEYEPPPDWDGVIPLLSK